MRKKVQNLLDKHIILSNITYQHRNSVHIFKHTKTTHYSPAIELKALTHKIFKKLK